MFSRLQHSGPVFPDGRIRNRADDPDRKFLQSRKWRDKLRPAQLAREPLCRFCKLRGEVRAAQSIDHIWRPFGNVSLQINPDNHMSLCDPCHLMKSNAERAHADDSVPLVVRLGTDAAGWPISWTRPPKPEAAEPGYVCV